MLERHHFYYYIIILRPTNAVGLQNTRLDCEMPNPLSIEFANVFVIRTKHSFLENRLTLRPTNNSFPLFFFFVFHCGRAVVIFFFSGFTKMKMRNPHKFSHNIFFILFKLIWEHQRKIKMGRILGRSANNNNYEENLLFAAYIGMKKKYTRSHGTRETNK